jgi:hypothetical protein
MTKLFRLLLLKKTKTGAYIFSKGETIGAYIYYLVATDIHQLFKFSWLRE